MFAQVTAPDNASRGHAGSEQGDGAANAGELGPRARHLGARQAMVEKGWAKPQQGSTDVQNLKALEAGLAVAQAAPFDGVVTQRNVDVGSLVQADAASGTFMFTIMQTKVIRIQVFVPQDRAFGLGPGVEAVVRVPEIPDRTFTGKVTRIADALQPGTRTLLTEIDVPNTDGRWHQASIARSSCISRAR